MANGKNSDTLEGEIVRVSFHNEESGFSVLRVHTAEVGASVTVTGRCPSPHAGERISARGQWENDEQFGRQFAAEVIDLLEPVTTSGIELFLASGLIDGVGPKVAERIVGHFGKKVMHVLNAESKRLEEVEGVGSKRRKEIKASWDAAKEQREVMIFLFDHGISGARAVKIYQTYGDDTRSVLRNNPYQLAEDIYGVGFRTADDLAAKMGVDDHAPSRVRAALAHLLDAATSQGHAALPIDELMERTGEMISLTTDVIRPVLETSVTDGRFVMHMVDGRNLIYRPSLRDAEETIARLIKTIIQRKLSTEKSIHIEKALEWIRQQVEYSLSDGQMKAVKMVFDHSISIITGGPGVGKTTVLSALLDVFSAKGLKCKLAAPTGRAAQRMTESCGIDAQTMHRLLGYQPHGGFSFNRERSLEGDVFVLDEVSMVDLPLMKAFLSALPEGARVLLVGDADQLPSVGPGSVLSDLIASETVSVTRLTEVFRQGKGSQIISASHQINAGLVPDLRPEKGSDCIFLERDNPAMTRDTLLKLVAERLPKGLGVDAIDDVQVLTPMNKGLLGTVELNRALQDVLNPPHEFKPEIERHGALFRRGDKVIQTRNDYDKEVFNGDLGRIAEIEGDGHQIVVRFDQGRLVHYSPSDLDQLRLAYAITIHKSQGSEFPVVVIPLSTQHYVLLERNLLYTAITRGRQQVVLLGQRNALDMAVSRQQSGHRYGGLLELLKG